MVASQIRANARESLTGKWGKAALLILSYLVIMFVITWVVGLLSSIPLIGFLVTIAEFVISVPISYALIAVFMKLKRNEDVGYADFLSIAFANIGKVWGITWNVILKMLPLVIALIVCIIVIAFSVAGTVTAGILGSSSVSGFGLITGIAFIGYIVCIVLLIPKGFLYSLTNQILFDNPDMSAKEIVEQSEHLMLGHRWQLFWLLFSFIGWAFLAAFTFGIGYLWLMPYMTVALVCFYEELAGNPTTKAENTVSEDNGPIVEG